MTTGKLISVIIPIYNVEEYLSRCLKSIIENTYKNLEIICVNDGSSDKSLNILKEYKQLDNRIIIVDKPNKGVSSARNAGLRLAHGDYIAFIDADDWIHKFYFEFLYRAITESDCDISTCDYIKTTNPNEMDKEVSFSIIPISIIEMRSIEGVKALFVWRRLFKKGIIDNIWFDENEKVLEDCLYFWEIVLRNQNLKIAYVPAILYAYYEREGSLVSEIKYTDALELAERDLNYCKKTSRSDIRSILAEDALDRALSARYCLIILKDKSEIRHANKIIKDGMRYVNRSRLKYTFKLYCPTLVRLFLIFTDRSMLIFENNLRNNSKNTDT